MGFIKKNNIPIGEFRWLTVVSPEEPDSSELLLEPNQHPAAKTYQLSIYKDGISATAFAVDDIQKEYKRLTDANVVFAFELTEIEGTSIAVFDDTCGNFIQLYQT